jgi:hypothetical protein
MEEVNGSAIDPFLHARGKPPARAGGSFRLKRQSLKYINNKSIFDH